MSRSYILGFDGGGTKSEALLVRPDGVVCGWGRCDTDEAGSQVEGGRSRLVVHTALRRALSGLKRKARIRFYPAASHLPPDQAFPPDCNHTVSVHGTMESLPLLSLVPHQAGIVALGGTGSHVAGRNRAGQWAMCDGLGPQFGDFGGASFIGMQALRAAAMDHWHPRHQTSLTPLVFERCRALDGNPASFNLVGFFFKPRDRWQIASLARIVDEEAENGDPVARQILVHAAAGMAEVIYDVADRLGFLKQAFPLIGIGSVNTRSHIFWYHLRQNVTAFAPRVRPARLLVPPVVGITLHALFNEVEPAKRAGIQANLWASLPDYLPDLSATPLSYEPVSRPGKKFRKPSSALDCFIVKNRRTHHERRD